MKLYPATAWGIVAIGISLGVGCRRDDAAGPPEVRLGRDECLECGMIISEERSSCGLYIERRGRREYVLFDDIGCMLDVERDVKSDFTVLGRFVRDDGLKNWMSTDAAVFLMADPKALSTPMGSGLAAFAARADAETAQRRVGGQLLDYTQLLDARKLWMEQKYGTPRR